MAPEKSGQIVVSKAVALACQQQRAQGALATDPATECGPEPVRDASGSLGQLPFEHREPLHLQVSGEKERRSSACRSAPVILVKLAQALTQGELQFQRFFERDREV